MGLTDGRAIEDEHKRGPKKCGKRIRGTRKTRRETARSLAQWSEIKSVMAGHPALWLTING